MYDNTTAHWYYLQQQEMEDNSMENISEKINSFIEKEGRGSTMDALNVALARLENIQKQYVIALRNLKAETERAEYWMARYEEQILDNKKNSMKNRAKEIRNKIKKELAEWECIQDEADLLGITQEIMKIIKPLINQNHSNSAQNFHPKDINSCKTDFWIKQNRV